VVNGWENYRTILEMTTKYVQKNGNNGRREVYHVDPDCKRLYEGNYREAPESLIEWHDMDVCSWCGSEEGHPFNE